MSNSKSTTPTLKDRFLAEVRRDPKKASILGVLTLVLLISAIRLIATLGGSPSISAAAAYQPNGGMSAPSLRRPSAVTGDNASNSGSDTTGGADLALAHVPITRDIFTPDEVFFPFPEKEDKPDKKVVSTKVLDPNAQAQALREQVESQARSLVLQTTMVGADSTALINGKVKKVGQEIGGFRVVEINSQSCVLEKSGIQVKLLMAK